MDASTNFLKELATGGREHSSLSAKGTKAHLVHLDPSRNEYLVIGNVSYFLAFDVWILGPVA